MKHRQLIVDATWYTLAGYLIQPLTIASSLFVKGTIGPYLVGVIASLNLLLYYASFSHLGILNAAERDLPYCLGSGEEQRFARISHSTFTVTLIAAVVFSCGLLVWAFAFGSTLEKPLFAGILVYSIYIVFWAWSAYCMTLLRSHQEFVFLSKVHIVIGVVGSVGNVLAVIWFGFWGLLGVTLLTIVLQVILFVRHLGSIPSLRVDWAELRRLSLVGVPLLLFGLAMTGVKTIDGILALKLLGTEALGLYSIAVSTNTVVFQVTNLLSGVLYPRMQRSYGSEQTIESLSVYVIRPSVIMGVLLPFLIGALFFGMPVLVTWLLPQFSPGIPALKIVAVSAYFFAMFPMALNFLIALNKQLLAMVLLMIGIGLSALLGLVFVQFEWGLKGIALAAGGGYFVCFLSVNVLALRHWASVKETVRFIGELVAPILYAALLLALLDRYSVPLDRGVPIAIGAASLKMLVFGLAYLPMVFCLEPKTRLLSECVYPIAARLLRPRANS